MLRGARGEWTILGEVVLKHENPFMRKLGLTADDRAVVIHLDDVGMCYSSIEAFFELYDFGTVTSGSLMVPCPWFPEAARRCRERPDVDVGVHATLTSEWQGYRWGPVSTRDATSGLVDAQGYFPRTSAQVQASANAEAAKREIDTQMAMFYAAGLDATHIDTHMFAVGHEKFVQGYVSQVFKHRIPAMLPRPDLVDLEREIADPHTRQAIAKVLADLEQKGVPLLDAVIGMPLDEPKDQTDTTKRLLGEVPPGITHFFLHAAKDSAELRAISPDWESRVWNYKTMHSDEIRKFIESEGLVLLGYRDLRDAMRAFLI